jgi:hypothetical protein
MEKVWPTYYIPIASKAADREGSFEIIGAVTGVKEAPDAREIE